jgi:protein kinase A
MVILLTLSRALSPNLNSLDNYLSFFLYRIETFQDAQALYFVSEYVQGGELFRLIKSEKYFPNDAALFYATEILLALAYLHSQKIAYRDLKPENLIINSDGHIKMTDFGFTKKLTPG